ncbi:PAS domain-containing sensor histidine kinase [Pontibacter harenae]|uniref:PAS domain-containing sensor histidine kinase n=1 Tax=Pontibacter harenae TaxID=2894083 RepID=UPI001E3E6298|nr:PAS domain-containing sensor histidine kinase [Pontibacter harenae]MCC9169103.1 PAS domain-containing sensor histidine kinase [Pontibacter harenae]
MKSSQNKIVQNYVLRYSLDMICVIDEEARLVQISDACKQLLGFTEEELAGLSITCFVHPEDQSRTLETLQSIRERSAGTQFEISAASKHGQQVPLLWSVAWLKEENCFLCVVRDITAQKQAEKEMRRKEAVQRVLVDHGSDMQALLDAHGNYLYVAVAEPYERAFGYSPDQIMGANALSFVHPDDIGRIEQAFVRLRQTQEPVRVPDVRFKASNGEWRWVETTGSNQLGNPDVQAIVVSSRDITEQKQVLLQLAESEQRFKSLFDNNPSMVLYQNWEGTILDANPAFLSFVGKRGEDVMNRPLSDFLPSEAVPLCRQKLQEAFSGSVVSFEAEMTFGELGHRVLSFVKVPLTVAGRTVGAHTVITDITDVTQARRTVEQQAAKLGTIFESITDAFFTLDRNWNFTYTNAEFDNILLVESSGFIGRCIWDVYPEETNGLFYREYHRAVETDGSVHFQAYLERLEKWLEVKAFPSGEGLSVYFSDITEQVHQQKELEKLSLVASKTLNSVVILDREARIEWANESFTRLTGYTLPEAAGKKPFDLLWGADTDPVTAQRIKERAKNAQPIKEEVLVYRKSGEKRWFEVEVTPIFDGAGELVYRIGIQTDVTERVKSKRELEKLSLVASRTSNSIIIMDAERRVEWVNEGFTKMTGYTLAEIGGKDPRDLLIGPDTDKAELQRIVEKFAEGVSFNTNLVNYRKSGEAFWLAMDVSPVFGTAGSVTHFVAIQKDITFRKEAEANLVKMSQALYQQNKDLEQFTYIVSHNLRAPVANVLGLSSLLSRMDKGSSLYEETLSNLRLSAHRMDTVLRDLNTILSIRDSKGSLERERVNVKLKIQQALTSLQERLERCGGVVTVDMDEDLYLWANKAYLYSIFYNLLSNAIKYRSKERPLQVEIKCVGEAEEEVTISFEDNGSGFDLKKAKDKVFKLYSRFHPETEGRGIGLYLVKAHLEAMEGAVEVTSEVGAGTRFLLFLPKARHEDSHH